MQKDIRSLQNHYIVCGQGRVGKQVALELASKDVAFVVLDRENAELQLAKDKKWLYLESDPSDESSLVAANVSKARGLVAALGEDSDNVYLTLEARALNPNMTIIARANEQNTEAKLLKAGATKVMLPHVIGATRMAEALEAKN